VADLGDCKGAENYRDFAGPTLNRLNGLIRFSAFGALRRSEYWNLELPGGRIPWLPVRLDAIRDILREVVIHDYA